MVDTRASSSRAPSPNIERRGFTTLAKLQQHNEAVPSSARCAQTEVGDFAQSAVAQENGQRFNLPLMPIQPFGRHTPAAPLPNRWQVQGVNVLDGMGYNTFGAKGFDGSRVDAAVGISDGLAYGTLVSTTKVSDGSDQVYQGPFAAFWTNNLMFGWDMGLVDHHGQWGLRAMPSTTGFAEQRVDIKGNVVESLAKQCRKTLGVLDGEALYEVTINQTRRGQGVFTTSFSMLMPIVSWVRNLCRIDRTSACDNTYTTFVDGPSAWLAKGEHLGLLGRWAAPTWRALCNALPLSHPGFDHPQNLLPGSKMERKLGGGWGRMFLACINIFFVGHHTLPITQSRIGLSRSPDNNDNNEPVIDIVWGEMQQTSRRWLACIPGGVGADSGNHAVKEETLSFRAAWTPEVKKAWSDFMLAVRKGDVDEQRRAILKVAEKAGVADPVRQQTLSEIDGKDGGIRVYVLPRLIWEQLVPSGFGWGYSAQHRHGMHWLSGPRKVSDTLKKQDAQRIITYGEKVQVLGPSGTRKNIGMAIVDATHGEKKEGQWGASVLLASQWHLSHASLKDIEAHVQKPLETFFGPILGASMGAASPKAREMTGLAEATLKSAGWCSKRDTTVERMLGEDELNVLSTAEDQRLIEVAQHYGQIPSVLLALKQSLAELRSDSGDKHCRIAEAFDAYIRKTGILALPMVHKVLSSAPPPEGLEKAPMAAHDAAKLIVRTGSDVYERAPSLVRVMQRRALFSTQAKSAIEKQKYLAQEEILAAMALASCDMFLDDRERRATVDALRNFHTELENIDVAVVRPKLNDLKRLAGVRGMMRDFNVYRCLVPNASLKELLTRRDALNNIAQATQFFADTERLAAKNWLQEKASLSVLTPQRRGELLRELQKSEPSRRFGARRYDAHVALKADLLAA